MASRCAISASEARYRRIGPIVAKSTSSSSPRALRSPSQRRVARGARACHARDDRADGGGAQRRTDAELLKPRAQAELVHRPQGEVFHADRARADQLQGVDIDVLDVAAVSRGRGDGADALVGEQLGGDVLGVRFERRGTIARQWHLAAEEFVDAPAQRRPVALRDLEVSSQIEQGALSHLRARAFGAHEAEGEIAVVDTAGAGASDEHDDTIARAGCGRNI